MKKSIAIISIASILSGCATSKTPKNIDGAAYSIHQTDGQQPVICNADGIPNAIQGLNYMDAANYLFLPRKLNSADIFQLNIVGDKNLLSGNYIVSDTGEIALLGQHRIKVSGMTEIQAQDAIKDLLLENDLIRNLTNGVQLTILELGSVNIAINGAVFSPGVTTLGEKKPESRTVNFSNIKYGDVQSNSSMSDALQAAGGVRPDAAIENIYLIRDDSWTKVNFTGAFNGQHIQNIKLVTGDRLIVPSKGCLQEYLVRPSAITPPGIRVYMSNLTSPAQNNASAGIGVQTSSLPYGTRLSQAIVTANCVGGSALNASRKVVHYSRNPITKEAIVVERSVEDLVRRNNRDLLDPYLMTGDGIACYDGTATSIRDVFRAFGEVISPAILFKSLN